MTATFLTILDIGTYNYFEIQVSECPNVKPNFEQQNSQNKLIAKWSKNERGQLICQWFKP